jgi:hypothetical protein
MLVSAASSIKHRWSKVSATALFAGILSSCAEPTASSPAAGEAEPDFVSKSRRGSVLLKLHSVAQLEPEGSVIVKLHALCPSGFQVIEGPLTLMQGPEFQEIFGEGFFTNRCDGRWHVQRVRVRAPEGFQRGTARASATLMVEDPTTAEFLQGDAGGTVRIR